MKPPILLLALTSALALGSCTTAYKTGQTPDDVYYSPVRPEDEYVRVEKKEERRYEGIDEYYDDRYLRMKVRNRYRWNELDDWYYFGSRYNYSAYYNSWSNPWTPQTYWNCTHNPYYHGVVIVTPKSPTYSKPRTFNLNAYNNNSLTNSNYKSTKTSGVRTSIFSGPRNTYSNPTNSNSSNTGSFLRNIFSGGSSSSNSSSNNSSSSPTKTTTSSSSGSGSSGGGSAPVRRF